MSLKLFKKSLILPLALTMCIIPMKVNATATQLTSSTRYVNESNQDKDASLTVNIVNRSYPKARMSSAVGNKRQVLTASASKLRPGHHVSGGTKYIDPKQTLTYYVVCTANTNNTTANVGFTYTNSTGRMIIQSTANLGGYDTYGTIVSNPTYRNYVYIENTGNSNLTASYVYMQ